MAGRIGNAGDPVLVVGVNIDGRGVAVEVDDGGEITGVVENSLRATFLGDDPLIRGGIEAQGGLVVERSG